MLDVSITNRQKRLPVDRPLIRRLVRAASPAEWQGATVSIVLVGDDEIRELNQQYLNRAEVTDVLAFPLDGPDSGRGTTIGEVVVSAERAAEEAGRRGLSAAEELALYVVHGILHLSGFDDHRVQDRRAMQAKETEILDGFGFQRAHAAAPDL